jgi:hypothetical protein
MYVAHRQVLPGQWPERVDPVRIGEEAHVVRRRSATGGMPREKPKLETVTVNV